MPFRHSILPLLTGAFLVLLAGTTHAEQFRSFDNIDIHYIALTTDFLQPQVARTYGITRSKNRGMLNISLIEQVPGTTGRSIEGEVRVEAINPVDQHWSLAMRKIVEQDAIYYIADFPVTHAEELLFRIRVRPQGRQGNYEISFRHRFFVH